MKKGLFISLITILGLFALMLKPAVASSAAGISPSSVDIPFFPNYEQALNFNVIGYDAIEFEMQCPYVYINNKTLIDADGVSHFSAVLKLPEKIDSKPGIYNCGFIMHRPKNPDMPQGIGAFAEVAANINILIPVKGKYATINLNAQNANKGEPIFFKIEVQNLGDTALRGINAIIDISDIDGRIKETAHTATIDIEPFSSSELWKRIETENLEPARYNAKATMSYGGEKPAYAETSFLIGKLFVKFIGLNINATAGKINPLKVNVESWWGNPIENVRAEIKIYDTNNTLRGEFRTESADLQPWQKASLSGYWDANGLEAGVYGAELTLLYKGGETKEKVKLALQKQPKEGEDGKAFEAIKETLTSPIFLALLVLILIINVSIWLIKQKKQGRRQ